jgi:hypothetical protein
MGAEGFGAYAVPPGVIRGKKAGKLVPVLGADPGSQGARSAYAQNPNAGAGVQHRAGKGPPPGLLLIEDNGKGL